MKVSGQLHAAVALSLWKAHAIAIGQEASWTPGEQENHFSLESNRISSVVQPAA